MSESSTSTIADPRQIQLVLEEAVQMGVTAELVLGLERLQARLEFPETRFHSREICFLIPASESVQTWATRVRGGGALVKVQLAGSLIEFPALWVSSEPRRLRLAVPTSIQKTQRRRAARVDVLPAAPVSVAIRFRIQDPKPLQKPVSDISAGGLAFWVSEEEKLLFRDGESLEEITVRLPGTTAKCRATVRGVWALAERDRSPQGSYKVALEFEGLAQRDEAAIARYVLEVQRKKSQKV